MTLLRGALQRLRSWQHLPNTLLHDVKIALLRRHRPWCMSCRCDSPYS